MYGIERHIRPFGQAHTDKNARQTRRAWAGVGEKRLSYSAASTVKVGTKPRSTMRS